MAKQRKPHVKVEAVTHQDKRTNIPTQELSDFMTDEQRASQHMLYARDSSLDPQLVWKGKDAQDSEPLTVEARPIYIQEKIQPLAIIETVRAQAKAEAQTTPHTLDMFADFNGIDFEEQVDFYRHPQKWTNRMILGDSLQVMCSLAAREGLKGQVQMIYIDPPYGIEFGSNWQVSTQERTVKDGKVDALTRQPEQVKAFRDTWELGIHSYLAYLRDRLVVARELLTESGSVFVQIGDENLHLVRSIMDEVFGSENAHPLIVFRKKMMPLMKKAGFEAVTDYILWYQNNKSESSAKLKRLFVEKDIEGDTSWNWVQFSDGQRRVISQEEMASHKLLPPHSQVFQPISMLPREYRKNQDFVFDYQGKKYPPPKGSCWSTTPEGMTRLKIAGRLHKSGEDALRYVYFHNDYPIGRLTAVWMDTGPATNMRYVVETNTKIVERLIVAVTDPGDLVFDPTCGSGTTAYVAEQWGRRWITSDTSRVALALARTRLMSARFPYYLLADSPKGVEKIAELKGQIPSRPLSATSGDIRQGFVYHTVPHIKLGAITNNPELDDIHARWHTELEPLLQRLNRQLHKAWEEWQVPREPGEDWPAATRQLLDAWWEKRYARQAQLDASIARHAETETLYDRPYEDRGVVRVAGPFTVESLSPHRAISPSVAAEQPLSTRAAKSEAGTEGFEALILDNLREAGVQNTKLGERLTFDRLEARAGVYLQAEGDYTDKTGQVRRVAVAIGPEHGTVGKDLLKDAAREAVSGLGVDLLLICGFAFDPEVNEEAKQLGRLMVLPVRMNPDLTMASLLKKTDTANLFMVFGEPDLDVQVIGEKVTITLKGLDIYDPTTGVIRSSSTDDIACWFIDTNYNSSSFFVRHAYFTGGKDPYEQLRRALRADINESAWSALYRTTSLPFDRPKTGKIAVKVINHYGDEVLKVYPIAMQ